MSCKVSFGGESPVTGGGNGVFLAHVAHAECDRFCRSSAMVSYYRGAVRLVRSDGVNCQGRVLLARCKGPAACIYIRAPKMARKPLCFVDKSLSSTLAELTCLDLPKASSSYGPVTMRIMTRG